MKKQTIIQLDPPGGAVDILLHTCCAPCSGAILECMLQNRLRPVVFYFNPNIYPAEEYGIRKSESKRFAETLHIPFIDGDYNRNDWLKKIQGLETEPERGKRCIACFKIRMAATAYCAVQNGFSVFTTTLASSRWKSTDQINEAGKYAESLCPGTFFWTQNWRKGGLSIRRRELIEEHKFYNQTYCGCEFSIRKERIFFTPD
ncbi:MAG: epoxyqueuosine reductase QueH [Tannerella sp.]|nr:epoxyqueuosine reductase QueH [Tannerella sp.]